MWKKGRYKENFPVMMKWFICFSRASYSSSSLSLCSSYTLFFFNFLICKHCYEFLKELASLFLFLMCRIVSFFFFFFLHYHYHHYHYHYLLLLLLLLLLLTILILFFFFFSFILIIIHVCHDYVCVCVCVCSRAGRRWPSFPHPW